ncbi:hypothetical protein NDU88_001602 [Pleurodeles waltl]|uniref:Uncharacterized protein n=1 Tax=Pleurodeles waltl TaxID=8319 RepID=A0AAV7KL69_PLEWA|nr:hypothetical protein NDU88_000112 [Pleurodeles waltl]KAJ1113356.1 hypothetical protein NDU88_001602 [Pleurodeles waltl]
MAQSSQKTGYVLIQDGAVVTEDGVRPCPRWRSPHRRRGTSLSKMAQSSQKTEYVLFQDGAVFTLDGTEYVLIQDGAVFTLDGVRPFPRRPPRTYRYGLPLMQMSPLERERVITKMAYDLTGDGCDPVGKWLLRLPVQTPDAFCAPRPSKYMYLLECGDMSSGGFTFVFRPAQQKTLKMSYLLGSGE